MSPMPPSPLVTVGLLVHNGERTLRESLDSVLGQTFTDFEVVISDDASSDRSAAICEEYVQRDPRVRLIRQPVNIGGIKNFNAVVTEASGTYFLWMTDHDRWLPGYLEACVAELEAHPSAVLCYGRTRLIDPEGRPVGEQDLRMDTLGLSQQSRLNITLWGLEAGTARIYGLQRTSAMRRLKRYPEVYRDILAPDVVLLLELALLGDFIYVDDVFFELRTSPSDSDKQLYMRKLHVKPRSGFHGALLFGRIVAAEFEAIRAQVGSPARRLAARVGVVNYMAARYSWLLTLLWQTGRQNRRR